MPLKLRRTLSMEDLQNASDDEMDVLLSASEDIDSYNSSSRRCLKEASSSGRQQNGEGGGGSSQRFFPFSLISNDSTSTSSSSAPPTQSHSYRPRPKNHVPVFVPVPDASDDFFLHGPQAPRLSNMKESCSMADGGGGGNFVDSKRINGIEYQSKNGRIHHNHHDENSCNTPISKGVTFQDEELDEEEYNHGERDRRSSIHAQVNQVTQKMKDNMSRLLEREASLDSFADLTDQLHYSGDIYRQSTEHLRRKLWWRQQKTRFVLTALIIFFMLLLLVPLISRLFRGNWG